MNSLIPETRNSLIARLPNADDAQAWGQFTEIYQPLVFRLALSKGFQDSDAREIVQEVMIAVSQAVNRFEPDPQRGRFRDWLFRIARNLMIKFLTRRKYQPLGNGGSNISELLSQQVEVAPAESAFFDLEYRREVFRWAAQEVSKQMKPANWRAFWLTSVENLSAAQAAEELGMSVGAVYVARSRALSRLRKKVKRWEQQNEN